MLITMALVLSLSLIVIQFFSRRIEENEKPYSLVFIQYAALISLVVCTAATQFDASNKENKYKQAKLDVEVLSKITELYLPTIRSAIEIEDNMVTAKSYLSYQQAKKENPVFSEHIDWHRDASESHKEKLKSTQRALHTIQENAAIVVRLSSVYEDILPNELVAWAERTLKIRFDDVEIYFDPYRTEENRHKESVVGYYDQMNRAFTTTFEKIRAAVKVVKST